MLLQVSVCCVLALNLERAGCHTAPRICKPPGQLETHHSVQTLVRTAKRALTIFFPALVLFSPIKDNLSTCTSSEAQEVAAGAPAEVLLTLLCHERADTGRTAAYSLPSALDARTVCSR